jgi:hypothetical protein
MRRMPWFFLGLTVLFLHEGRALAEAPFIEGDWWLKVRGDDKGALLLTFSNQVSGTFDVSGSWQTLATGEPFRISVGQALSIDSKGHIFGVLSIEDLSGTPLGTLQIQSGSLKNRNKKESKRRLKLKGLLLLGGSPPIAVSMSGGLLLTSLPTLTGRTVEGKVKGSGLRSRFYDFSVSEDEILNFPFFQLTGEGPVSLDGLETSVTMQGQFIRDPGRSVFGSFSSPELGDGVLTGKLYPKKRGPRANFHIQADRDFRLKGSLEISVAPILSVSPDQLDFGDVTVGDSQDLTFTVTNVGAGTLDGRGRHRERPRRGL